MNDADPDAAYRRGAAAGRIDERLAAHDRHFDSINTSLSQINSRLHEMALTIQALGATVAANHQHVTGKMNADAATAAAAATALARDVTARRQQSELRFAPWQKVMAIVASVLGLALFVMSVIQFAQS